MNLLIYLFSGGILLSLIANLFLLSKIKQLKLIRRANSIELREFLSDLDSGGGMLAVRRMDPNDFLLRSPKK